ncbi:MAG TPA: hypothetical protein VMU59_09310 [Caulobacteraceae bacterium]|nr:hypothetical protein [Caulobacteraceae bacterium]
MSKHYGALVGAVKQLIPFRPVDAAFENTKDEVLVRDVVTLAAAPAADTIQLGLFGWESIIDPVSSDVLYDNLGAGTTLSVGDATYPTALLNAQGTSAAGTSKIGQINAKTLWFAPLWQALGYASLAAAQKVGTNCELLATIGGAAATGNLAWSIKGQKRI